MRTLKVLRSKLVTMLVMHSFFSKNLPKIYRTAIFTKFVWKVKTVEYSPFGVL